MTRKFWLVKFPRGEKTAIDRNILRTEKLYYEIAKWFGLKTTTDPIEWDSDCLFVPRFDREVKGKNVAHYGLESFYSLANEINFGSRLEHETYIIAIKKFSTKKNEDALEYIFREFLNEMMGNTDNHGRNTSMFKQGDQVEISPLYDFAPMQFDPEGIVRNTNWSKKSANGNIAGIGNFLASEKIVSFDTFKEALSKKLPKLKILDKKMREVGVPEKFIAGTLNDRNRRIKEIEDFCSNA
jgi:serine/threonine-protein kinase HipA